MTDTPIMHGSTGMSNFFESNILVPASAAEIHLRMIAAFHVAFPWAKLGI
jgi:hypothetical protein